MAPSFNSNTYPLIVSGNVTSSVYRHPNMLYAAAVGVILALATLMGLYRDVVLRPGERWWLWLVFFVAFLYASVFRFAPSGAYVADAGVAIRNPMSRRRFYAWSEIEDFTVGKWGVVPRMGYLRPKKGPSVHIFAILAAIPSQREDPGRMIGMLNEELRTMGGQLS